MPLLVKPNPCADSAPNVGQLLGGGVKRLRTLGKGKVDACGCRRPGLKGDESLFPSCCSEETGGGGNRNKY